MAKNFRSFAVGSKVKLSGKFLKSTGQGRGSAGLSVWTVVACPCTLCKSGRFVATDEQHTPAEIARLWTPAEMAEMPYLAARHFNRENLVIVGQVDHRNCP
jgi:hypothetical protein